MENFLVLIFVRNNGAKHTVKFPFPADNLDSAKVKALGQYIVSNQVYNLGEGVSLNTFSGAFVQNTTESPIAID